jgi:hypothetical protein
MSVAYERTQDLGIELDLGDIEDDGMARWESKMLAKAADFESKSRFWVEQLRAQEQALHPSAKPPKPATPARPIAPPASKVPPVASTVPASPVPPVVSTVPTSPSPPPPDRSEAPAPSRLNEETRSLLKVGLIGTATIAGIFLVGIAMSRVAR